MLLTCFMVGTFHFHLKELLLRIYIWLLISVEINDVSLHICWRKSQVPLTKKKFQALHFLCVGVLFTDTYFSFVPLRQTLLISFHCTR